MTLRRFASRCSSTTIDLTSRRRWFLLSASTDAACGRVPRTPVLDGDDEIGAESGSPASGTESKDAVLTTDTRCWRLGADGSEMRRKGRYWAGVGGSCCSGGCAACVGEESLAGKETIALGEAQAAVGVEGEVGRHGGGCV